MHVGINLAETPGCAKIRKFSETLLYIILLFFIYPISLKDDHVLFKKYIIQFNKSYDNDTIYRHRFQAFMHSLQAIDILNANRSNGCALYGLTKYSDMFPEEFITSQLKFKLLNNLSNKNVGSTNNHSIRTRSSQTIRFNIPNKIDLRAKNVVSGVKSQGSCGACWAFAVVGVIETVNALKTGNLTRLSVQQMIDCSNNNYGCDGGDICSLLYWLTYSEIDIIPDDDYPLTLESEKCKNITKNGVRIKKFKCNSFVNEEDVMLYLLSKLGSLAVCINAQTWQHYVGGIIQYHCDSSPSKLNHAVQIVGYDLTAPVPYYIIKNSWGEDFGHNGYLYIEIGNNLCGLAHRVASVL